MDWKQIIRFLRYLKPHWRPLLITWLLSLVILALQGVTIWVGADFIQSILGMASRQAASPGTGLVGMLDLLAEMLLRRSTPMGSLSAAVAVLVIASVAVAVLRVVKLSILAWVNQSTLASIRCDLFAQVARLPLAFSLTRRHGEVASLFVRDVDELNYLFIDLTDRVFMQPLKLLFAVFLMYELSADLTLWSLLIFVPTAIVIHRLGKRIQELAKRALERAAELQAHLTEYLSSTMLARSLGRESREQDGFARNAASLRDTQFMIMVMAAMSPQVLRIAVVIGGGFLLLMGGREVLVTHQLEGETLTRLVLLLPMVAQPLESLASLYLSLRRSSASARRLGAVLDLPPPEAGGVGTVERLKDGIVLRGVAYSADGVPIIEGLDLTIPARGVTVLAGASGSGKTTLMNLVAGFIRPQRGGIMVDGQDLLGLDSSAWCGKLGIVHQEPILLNASVRENLAYAAPEASAAEMLDALTRAGLREKIEGVPDGMETVVGNRGGIFSGGERQRLAIARALLRQPVAWLFDEPTAHLDGENRERVIGIIRELGREAAVVVATHDPALLEVADVRLDLGDARRASVRPEAVAG